MREMLFKGKAINRDKGCHRTKYKNGDWIYGLVTRLYDNRFENLPAEMTDINGVSGIEVDYKTIGQYTGLTDKNGKKIFEGDIIIFNRKRNLPNTNQTPEVIIYNQRDCAFQRYPYFQSVTKGGAGKLIQPDMMSECEVIGNIHDNPELLKE